MYPELAAKQKYDIYLAAFEAKANCDPVIIEPAFDPANLMCRYPDFGFDNEMQFVFEKPSWGNFLDYISDGPNEFTKYSRVHNYVKFVTERKEDDLLSLGIRTGRYGGGGGVNRDIANIG